MANGRPLFAGTSENDQLCRIFKNLGTPNEEVYPQIGDLPDYKVCATVMITHIPHLSYFPLPMPQPDFAVYERPASLNPLVPSMGQQGCELLGMMLAYDPGQRISAQDAMGHAYFDDLSSTIKNLG